MQRAKRGDADTSTRNFGIKRFNREKEARNQELEELWKELSKGIGLHTFNSYWELYADFDTL